MKPKVFILDVDGVLNTGRFFYTKDGKVMKEFGADDSDALKVLNDQLEIRFVSGDKRGFPISKARVEDMKFQIDLVSTSRRAAWIKERYDPKDVIYMGDGILDFLVFREVAYGIAPANGDPETKAKADFVTEATGGNRAVAEACRHVGHKFFGGFDIEGSTFYKGNDETAGV
ncbi:MAG: HAD hydrolase family protein [Candidatus Melainabacteria bacterium]|nr:HAD hydrolase family protein [Candidatus Melainabacteria bacterium]